MKKKDIVLFYMFNHFQGPIAFTLNEMHQIWSDVIVFLFYWK